MLIVYKKQFVLITDQKVRYTLLYKFLKNTWYICDTFILWYFDFLHLYKNKMI